MRGMGGRVTYIAPDWSEIRVRLRLKLRTRNYVGTIFGGSLYGSVDPYYMLMLMQRLGDDYVVWDKAATIQFKRPAHRTVYATFRISDDDLADIAQSAAERGELDRTFVVDLVDQDGVRYATVEKVLYIATREAYVARARARKQN